MNSAIAKLIKKHGMEKILSSKEIDSPLSAKKIVRAIIDGDGKSFPTEIWESAECLNAEKGVDFAGFILDVRAIAFQHGFRDVPMYNGAIRTISRMLADNNLKQKRLDWIINGLKTSPKSKTVLFIGDLPYYEEICGKDSGFSPLDTARGALRLLNEIGIAPAVLEDEVSSGYDELWSGDIETFRKLAEKNIKAIKKSGAKEILTLDAGSFYALSKEYPKDFKDFKIPVVHITQKLSGKISSLQFDRMEETITYHDPCFMKQQKIFEEPRQILNAVPDSSFIEMKHNRENALCTGAHRFANCGAVAKRMQVEMLKEAENAGAEILVTSCPREAIILKLALRSESWKEANVEIKELIELVSELLIQK